MQKMNDEPDETPQVDKEAPNSGETITAPWTEEH
jgi:hypothetical protein